ncbi:MAG: LOW QUALITY PROTEIN: tRNA methyltransferase, partial [Olpidium bornovanus]
MDVDGYVEITEGKATILFPKGNEVFYNPVQEFNRDMSIAAIRTWDKLRRQEVEEKRAKHRAYKMPAAGEQHTHARGNPRCSLLLPPPAPSAFSSAPAVSPRIFGPVCDCVKLGFFCRPVEAKAEAKEGNQLGRVEAKAEAEEGTTAAGAEPLKSALAIDSTPPQSAAAPDSRPPPRLRFKILEALSASGLRSVRYAKEISGVDEILANDLVAEAVESIKRNVEHNKLPPGLVVPNSGDAMDVMYAHRNVDKRFDVVDLDPYGSASQFIDGAVQSVANGGLLCVTCTDLGVLAGNQHRETWYVRFSPAGRFLLQANAGDLIPPESPFAKYGSMTAKTEACHEMALRIVLNTLQTSAARYKRCIVPLLSCSIDFYVRLFVRVFDSAGEVKKAARFNLSMVYVCHGCRSFTLNPLCKKTPLPSGNGFNFSSHLAPPVDRQCEHCGKGFHIAGPVWNGPIHDAEFVKQMLSLVKESPEGTFG